jgi:hypothetical protein
MIQQLRWNTTPMNVLKETPIPPISRVVSVVSMSHHYIYAPIPLPTIPTSLFQNSSFGSVNVPIETSLKSERRVGVQD